MATALGPSNKAKIARRVVEVLEYFDDDHREATVMDIVRRYDRPQSSTSELLSSLVDLGLLFKDHYSRSYRLTPRAALIGAGGQSAVVRDGRLVGLIDRLAAQTGLPVALFGMVGLRAQIVSWRGGTRCSAGASRGLYGGMQAALSGSAAGWLLMATIAPPRCDGIVRRLSSEASDSSRFSVADMTDRVCHARETGHVQGPIGFGSSAQLVAALLPVDLSEQPIAIGLVYGGDDAVNPVSLHECLDEALHQLAQSDGTSSASLGQLHNAA